MTSIAARFDQRRRTQSIDDREGLPKSSVSHEMGENERPQVATNPDLS